MIPNLFHFSTLKWSKENQEAWQINTNIPSELKKRFRGYTNEDKNQQIQLFLIGQPKFL